MEISMIQLIRKLVTNILGWNESIDEDTLDRIYYLCNKYNWVRDSVIKPKED